MKIGFNQATSMNCSTLEIDVQLCEKNGFDFIELRLDKLQEYFQHHNLDDLKKLFSGKRLKPHALNAFYLTQDLFSKKDPEADNAFIEEFRWGCHIAREINAGYLIVVPPLQRDPQGEPWMGSIEDAHRDCVRILRCLSAIASEYALKLCFELVGFNRSSVRTLSQASNIIKEVNQSNIGLVLDAWNMHLNGGLNDFSEITRIDPSKIFSVHINNGDMTDITTATQAHRRFCDSGVVDLKNFLSNLQIAGYTGIASIEVFRPEYWQKDPEWVISEAYKTTHMVLSRNSAIG